MLAQALTPRLWQDIKSEYVDRVDKAVSTGNLFDGENTHRVESRIMDLTGRRHCVFTNSGSSAILMTLLAYKIGPGDEVICPNLSYVASANQIPLLGATPVFVDADKHGHIDVRQIESKITTRTKAIMPVSLYGENYDHDSVMQIAERHNLIVIEDSAQSYNTTYKGRPSGSLGHASILSFSRNKPAMSPFGAGAIVTDDEGIANITRLMRTHGKKLREGKIQSLGLNAQAKEDRAIAVDLALDRMEAWTARRKLIHQFYTNVFTEVGIEIKKIRKDSTINGHKFIIFTEHAKELLEHMSKNGVQLLRYYQDNFEHSILGPSMAETPITDHFQRQSVCITTDPYLRDDEYVFIANKVKEFLV
jgi:UDP-2-acetamido-2-deoxy-ribo-hexuluronate aminotransferase